MTRLKTFWLRWQAIILIIIASIFAFGLRIPWLGFYIDDWTFTWTYKLYGSQGLLNYFAINRPFWGLTYQLTFPIFGDNILAWHIFGLVCRILLSLSFYWLLKLLWPKRPTLVLFGGLLFAVYPGFLLQPIALCWSHIWLVYLSFILSNCFTILAVRNQKKRILFSSLAVILALYNILCMEYFLPLEVLRLVLLFYVLADPLPFIKRVWHAFKWWLPYLASLAAVMVYRLFFYTDQTRTYKLYLLDAFKESFSKGVSTLGQALFNGIYQSAVFAWVQPFIELFKQYSSSRIYLIIIGLVALTLVGLLVSLLLLPRPSEEELYPRRDFSPLVISVFALLLAGIPFYVTLLPIQANAINSRFTMPFMIGASLLLAYLLDLIPMRWLKVLLLSLVVAFSVGFHLLNANNYRLMSVRNNELMYEIAWRAPSLKPGTMIISTEQDISQYFTYSTLRSELNLIYPHEPNSSFGWIFPRELPILTAVPLQPDVPIHIDMATRSFDGNSSDIVVFQTPDIGCARFIDSSSIYVSPEISKYEYEKISNPEDLITDPGKQTTLNASLIGPEPAHGWCYYFEKSDLALQEGDYASIVQNYQIVKEKSYKANYGYEWFPFIRGLANAGEWQQALDLGQQVIAENPTNNSYQPFICQYFREAAGKSPTADASAAIGALNCQ